MSLFIVMPVFNERDCIEKVIRSWLDLADRAHATLLVVDDGSTDGCAEILESFALADSRLKLIHQKNLGHGPAIMHGYRSALDLGATWIFQTDSDGQFSPSDFVSLWENREGSPFVVGWRLRRAEGLHRKMISWVLRVLLRLSFGVHLLDPNIPLRLMRADFLKELLRRLPESLRSPNIYLSVLAEKAGARLMNIPVINRRRRAESYRFFRFRTAKLCATSTWELIRLKRGGLDRNNTPLPYA